MPLATIDKYLERYVKFVQSVRFKALFHRETFSHLRRIEAF